MPRPRTPKPHTASRDGSGEDSDATVDPSTSLQTRRTRKRPAHLAREASEGHPGSQPAVRPHSHLEEASCSAEHIDLAERRVPSPRHRHAERPSAATAALPSHHLASSSVFETPNQARDRLALMHSGPSDDDDNTNRSSSMNNINNNSSTTPVPRQGPPHRVARSTRSDAELRVSNEQAAQNGIWRATSLSSSLDAHSSSSRQLDVAVSSDSLDAADALMTPVSSSSPQDGHEIPTHVAGPLTLLSHGASAQLQSASVLGSNVPMVRTSSNMSPPRPTRSLPRRRASARTQSRPLLSSTNSASSSYALRSRSTSSSNILAPSNSNANILASTRQNLVTGCIPLGGGFDPNYNPPSGMSTPRTPLAEIPLWLADMRSESRRSSTSSSSFMDREDLLTASRSASSRHARTLSTSSSGPSSPGATRNGSTSPVIPFRRSLRGRRPRQSDENARISPSPSYFGEFDALPSPSSASIRGGDMVPVDEALDPNTSLSSSMIHLGTSSPSTPSVHLQTSSPAMSTRSRTLNRAGSVRCRRMTNPLNAPVSTEPTSLLFQTNGSQDARSHSAFQQARSTVHHERARHGEGQRSSSLLERRAATAAAVVPLATSHMVTRASSRPSSRTSSPARATRASRRRSMAAEGQTSSVMDTTALGPRPAQLPPLQIPGARLAREAGLLLLDVSNTSSAIPEHASEELVGMTVQGQHAVQIEPVSPSAFSEMTSLTQGSTASESINSAGGMPATPSSSISTLDPFAQTAIQDATLVEAGSSSSQPRQARGGAAADAEADATLVLDSADAASRRALRQATSQRKPALASRDADVGEDALGIQLRPRP